MRTEQYELGYRDGWEDGREELQAKLDHAREMCARPCGVCFPRPTESDDE